MTTVRNARKMLGRAMRLRCPHCGGGPIFSSWFKLKERCPRCRLRMQRGESDYFLGAYTVGLIVIELLFAVLFALLIMVTWPDPPWIAIQYALAAAVIIGVLVWYPFSKTVWLAIDLTFRPVRYEELGWHEDEAQNSTS